MDNSLQASQSLLDSMIFTLKKLSLQLEPLKVELLFLSRERVSTIQPTRRLNSKSVVGKELWQQHGTGKKRVLIALFHLFSGFSEDRKYLRKNLNESVTLRQFKFS